MSEKEDYDLNLDKELLNNCRGKSFVFTLGLKYSWLKPRSHRLFGNNNLTLPSQPQKSHPHNSLPTICSVTLWLRKFADPSRFVL